MMSKEWEVEFKPKAFKELKKLDKTIQKTILDFLEKLTQKNTSPRDLGIPLQGASKGFWRYRVGDYRLICDIQDGKMIILVLGVGHRKEVYRLQNLQNIRH